MQSGKKPWAPWNCLELLRQMFGPGFRASSGVRGLGFVQVRVNGLRFRDEGPCNWKRVRG